MLSKNEMMILASLRKNSRQSLTKVSKETSIPVSTVYDKIKQHENGVIKKFTSILDFPALGFNIRANVLVKGKKKELRDFLLDSWNVNSVFQLNEGYDFAVDCIFRYMSELKEFMDQLEKMGVKKEVYYVTDELRREDFLNSAKYLNNINKVG
ncbi:hypothetical protein A3K72_00060 [Candidatus Woesearchaeota archaeon RBG_13_36_6]|nr:MAG: hypothetical protein A3K72_00060 [Candidatus Woesearchaeota archaeon RBG_13_36_6]